MDTTPNRRRQMAIALVALALGVQATAGVAVAAEDPRFEVYVPEPTLEPGRTTTLTVQLVNDAEEVDDRVEEARNVKATMGAGDTPVSVESGTKVVGSMADGVFRDVSFTVSVPADIESGTYRLPIELTYEYEGDERETTTVYAEVHVEDRARFVVVSADANVSVGETGPVNVTMRNVGSAAASDASVTLTSQSPAVGFAGASSDTRFAGEWRVGETRTLSYRATVAPDADPGRYSLAARVAYDDEDGNPATSRSLSMGFTTREQTFAVEGVDASLQVGHEGTVSGTVLNEGPNAVRDAVVILRTDAPNLTPLETEYALGDLAEGERAGFSFPVMTTAGAGAGPRQLSLVVRYRDRSEGLAAGDTIPVVADVAAEQRFVAETVSSTLRVDHEGTITGTLTNGGPVPVESAVVVLRRGSSSLTPTETEYAVGDLGVGETAEFEFDVSVAKSSSPGPRQVSVVVEYRDRNGDRATSDPLDLRARVGPEQLFEVRDVTGSLRVGEEGLVEGRLVNTGNRTVTNAVVSFRTSNPNVNPIETEVSVGDLEPGEAAPFSFEVEISENAGAGRRQFSVSVRYRDEGGDVRTSDPLDLLARVGPKRDAFAVEPVDASLQAGQGGTVTLRVTNAGNGTVSDVSAKVFADDPLSVSDDEAFIDGLDPGESAEVVFAISAAGGAIPGKGYPISIDFQYEDAGGETKLSDTYTVAIRVTERSGGSGPSSTVLLVGALVLAAALAAGSYHVYRRR